MNRRLPADEIVSDVVNSSRVVGQTSKGWDKWRTETPLSSRYGDGNNESGLTDLGDEVLELYRGERHTESLVDSVHLYARVLEQAIIDREVGNTWLKMQAEDFISSEFFSGVCEVLGLCTSVIRNKSMSRIYYPTWLKSEGDLE